MSPWTDICDFDDIEPEDVTRVELDGVVYIAAKDDSGGVYVVDGLCTHEQVELADGFVFGCVLECPRHNGRFDLRDGRACGGPVTEGIKSYPTRLVGGRIQAQLLL